MHNNDTVCKNCFFAEYEGDTQTGCTAGRIEAFQDKGVNIIEAYDNDKEFYVIEDRICNYFRHKNWAKKGADRQLMVEKVKQETTIRLDVLIYLDHDVTDKQIITKLDSCMEQNPPVNSVRLILNKVGPVSYFMQLLKKYNSKLKWKIDNIVQEYDKGQAINSSVHQCNGNYYCVLTCNKLLTRLPDCFTKGLNKYINEDLNILAIMEDEHMPVYSKSTHDGMGGFGQTSLLDKIKIIAQEQNSTNLIVQYKDVFYSHV